MERFDSFLQLDLPALIVAMLAALLCSLLGSLLVLKRQAMMSDALSHAVLPGLAGAFILTASMSAPYMMAGALIACLVAVGLITVLTGTGRIESGAAMGIVFTALFALGIVLLETGVGSRVHLDAHHALYGALELVYWPDSPSLKTMPPQIITLLAMTLATGGLIAMLFKEIRIGIFDPEFAAVSGFRARGVNALVMLLVALATVACFEAVGSILVIALMICPAASARMLADRLGTQLALAALFGILSAVTGYCLAAFAPLWLGTGHSLSAAGMIALSAGFFQFLVMFLAPHYVIFRQQIS